MKLGQTSTKGPEEKTDNEIIAEFMGMRADHLEHEDVKTKDNLNIYENNIRSR